MIIAFDALPPWRITKYKSKGKEKNNKWEDYTL